MNIRFRECMMHREADYGVCHAVSIGEIFFRRPGHLAIGAEFGDEGIEVAAPQDSVVFHFLIELIAGQAVFLSIDKDGEVAVVVSYSRHVVEERDAFNVT